MANIGYQSAVQSLQKLSVENTNMEFQRAVESLEKLTLGNDDTNDVELSKLFSSCQKMCYLIEESSFPSSEPKFQEAIHVCIKGLEKCTLMVNELSLFSTNETVEELQTSSIRYLLLPAMLGSLNLNRQNKDLSERMKYVEIAEVYYKDYLIRCANYELYGTNVKLFEEVLSDECNERNGVNTDVAHVREKKIQQYKRKKELEAKENLLKSTLERPESDEEYVREYYLTLVEKWILTAVEELENLKREKDILKTLPKKEITSRSNKNPKKSEVKPLKPFIITKNDVQKQVFGLGYPSIPILTVDDFYRQRFEKMIEEQKENKPGKSLQDAAFSGTDLSKEDEDIEKERLLEKDDPAALFKARQWDDWKDDNPRGSGNRMNKG